MVSGSDFLLVTVLGLGEVESVLVCNHGATNEDGVVSTVLSFLQAALHSSHHTAFRALLAEMTIKMHCAKRGHLGISHGAAVQACHLSLLPISLALILAVAAHILD